ncbi:MAG TPA: SAM-dependent methyltransferase [Polyangiales bacterium]
MGRAVALTSEFVFALCQRGAETALKREAARALPELAPAYQRPGLVTFRARRPVGPGVQLPLVFARASGMSLGSARDLAAAVALLEALKLDAPLCLHVVERDRFRPDEEPPGYQRGQLSATIEQQVRAALPRTFSTSSWPERDQLVLTVIVAPDEPWLLGLHTHGSERSPHPGGRTPIDVPAEAPSRAYAKIEEAIEAFALPVRAGDVALELGAAPGGAAYALLRRGVSVWGVDPAEMDARALAFVGPHAARLTHLQMPMAALRREMLPEHVDWLLMDVHLAPQVALKTARRLASWYRGSLAGMVLTLKLNDWSFAERLGSFLAQAREMGIEAPHARQLASHRQELCIAGLTARGRQRTPEKSGPA